MTITNKVIYNTNIEITDTVIKLWGETMNEKILIKIKNLREERGLTLQQMAEILGYSSAKGYYEVENGKIKLRIEHLEKLSNFFNIPIQNFLS